MTDKLATIQRNEIDPYTPDSYPRAMEVASAIAKSRLFGITSPEAAFVVLATGHELGLSPMQSLRGIHIIEGRPSPSADAIAAIIIRSGLAEYFREVTTTATESTWETKRKGEPRRTCTFTLDAAKMAGLIKPNGNWQKYPGRMLAARAKAFLGRDVYPDLLLGLLTSEELTSGGSAEIPETEIVEALAAAPAPAPDPGPSTDDLAALIATATVDDLPMLANRVRELCPKGHPDRERLAAALNARKVEVTNAA